MTISRTLAYSLPLMIVKFFICHMMDQELIYFVIKFYTASVNFSVYCFVFCWGIILLLIIWIEAVLTLTNCFVLSDAKSFISFWFYFVVDILDLFQVHFRSSPKSKYAFLKFSLGAISVHIGEVEILYITRLPVTRWVKLSLNFELLVKRVMKFLLGQRLFNNIFCTTWMILHPRNNQKIK